MGRGEPGITPSLTTQLLYFRQEMQIRQPEDLLLRNRVNLRSFEQDQVRQSLSLMNELPTNQLKSPNLQKEMA